MGRQPVKAVNVVAGQASVQPAAKALGGLGRVLGDVPGDLLGRQLPSLVVVVAGEVVDVELLAPAGVPLRLTAYRRAGHGDSRDRLFEGVLEQLSVERLRWWEQTVQGRPCGRPPPAAVLGQQTRRRHGLGGSSPVLRVRWLGCFVPWLAALLEKSPLPPEEAAQTANGQVPTSRRAVLVVPASLRFIVIPNARQTSRMACIA
jgi:hypothetical protein